ncbi:MAG: 6-bladed beta-propeller [Planctomycetaceae bacterium]|nr:6-bladed beta-propeller [Planctomycetaceae bacterium]
MFRSLMLLLATMSYGHICSTLPSQQAFAQAGAVQEAPEEKPPADPLPPFPRINLAPWYEVDTGWPKKPAGFDWEAMPGIAVDQQDNIYIFTRSKPPVQVYRPDGTFVRAWGDDTIGNAHHIKIDHDGNVWVADIGLHIIRKFSPDGDILMTLGTEGVKGEDESHLNKPTDMAIARSGDVFVSDGYGNNRVVHFNPQGKFVKAWGQMGIGPRDFSLPHAIEVDSQGRIYVADRNNVRVQIYDQSGKLLDSWANVIVPWGFCMLENDELWVCGSSPMPWLEHPDYPGAPLSCPPRDQLVMKFNTFGRALELWTIPKGEDGHEQPGDVNWLHTVAVDSKGNLYLGDIIGKRAQKFVRNQR